MDEAERAMEAGIMIYLWNISSSENVTVNMVARVAALEEDVTERRDGGDMVASFNVV